MARTAITLRAARPGSGAPREEFAVSLRKRLSGELDPPAPQRPGGRRAFLGAATLAAGAAAAGASIDHALVRRRSGSPPSSASGTLTPVAGAWRPVVTSAALPEGAVHAFTVGGVSGIIERSGGRLRAVSGVCTHQGCRLVLAADPARLVCPCHGARFAIDGTVTWHRPGMTLTGLPSLAVREVNGVIQVYAPRGAGHQARQPAATSRCYLADCPRHLGVSRLDRSTDS